MPGDAREGGIFMALFTPEELEELRRADAELDEEFVQTQEEIVESRKRDRQAKIDRLDSRGKKSAENQRAYREANREKIAENKRAYYEANREKIAENQRAYFVKNRDKWNAYQREYRRKRREAAAV
jgi:hypothetical protein